MSKPTKLRVNGKPLPHVLTALIYKRREIAGQIEDLQRRLKLTVTELDNVECTIRIFKPDIDLSDFGPRPVPPPHAAFKGELSRILIDTIRESGRPLSTRELTEVVMRERGMPVDDLKNRRVMQQRVGATLNNWRRVKRLLKSSPGPHDMLMWELDREQITKMRDREPMAYLIGSGAGMNSLPKVK